MLKKEAYRLLGVFGILIILMLSASCIRINKIPTCPSGQTFTEGICCYDQNYDNLCDSEYCGDKTCQESEDCVSCWKDCGACKKIIYKYIPRNYTLGELTNSIRNTYSSDVKFKKDIVNSNDASTFFFYEDKTLRTKAFFMATDQKLIEFSKLIVLNNIIAKTYFVNNTNDIIKYLNYTRWYHTFKSVNTNNIINSNRIITGGSLDLYPTPVTGYKKNQKYANWEYKSYDMKENVLFDNITILDKNLNIVEDLYVITVNYKIKYKSSTFFETDEPDHVLDGFTTVEETGFNYIHSVNFICSRDLVITLYDYTYDNNELSTAKLENQINKNRAELLKKAKRIKRICNKEYSDELFSY